MATLNRISAVAIPLLLLLTFAAWAYASPVGSSPDDNFHLPSIWCGLGLRDGLCEDSGDPETRLVPAALLTATCFIFDSGISGACWDPAARGLGEATWINTGAQYPPLFYAAMSLFASPDVQMSVLLMRLSNALLAIGFLTAAFFALPRGARPALLVSVLATVVPLGMFLLASTNPSSWALISAATVWVCLYGSLRTTGSRQIVLCALAIIGSIIGAGARADAAAFAVFGVGLAFLVGADRGKPPLPPAIAGSVIVLTSAALFLATGQGGIATTGFDVETQPLTTADHVSNLLGIPGLWFGVFGSVPLGWLDTSMPEVVPVLAFAAFAGSIAIAIRVVGWRRGSALALIAAALWITPFILLAQSGVHVAALFVQPRYILPLLVMFTGVATLAPRSTNAWSAPRIIALGCASSVAAALALHVNLRRYTTGSDQPAIDPGANAEWWWTGAPPPLVIWIVGSVAFALIFALLAVLQGTRHSLQERAADRATQPSMGSIVPSDPASDSA